MSWHFSQALVAEYSEGICSAGAQSAPSSTNPMPQVYCSPDRMTAFSRLSRFGMTCAPLTDDLGQALLTWYLAAFPARTSPSPEEEKVSTASAPASGLKWPVSLARYDRATSSWKTPQLSLLADLDGFSETWPRWGTMRNGECWERQTWERRTKESGFGLLPTPLASIATNGGPNQRDSSGRPGLQLAATMWPTPTKSDGCGGPGCSGGSGGMNLRTAVKWPTPKANDAEKRGNFDTTNPRNGLSAAVKKIPTPTASMFKGSSEASLTRRDGQDRTFDRLDHFVMAQDGGQLNPTWVEWLMGWPLGWTDLKPLETDKCHSVPPKR